MDKKVIAVFCGSFNPPLNSHFSLAQQLLNEDNNIEKILFVPVGSKYNKEGLIPGEHRYNMLKLACDNNSSFEVSDIELQCSRQLYTFETLNLLQKQYPGYEIRLIIGTDNLKALNSWYEINNLLKLFKIIVLSRNEDNVDEIILKDSLLSKYSDSFIRTNLSIKISLSSTYVRRLIKENKNINYLLPNCIIKYIYDNNLYR